MLKRFKGTAVERSKSLESGYVVAMSALLLLPLLGFTAFAIDLGAWYARAAQIQRATDAAALAGVAYITSPDPDVPINAALKVAEQNGFKDGENGVQVIASPLPGDRMQVRIVDNEIPQYFTSLFRPDGVTVGRQSVAEYVPPIRMGSPRNFLGTGTLPRGTGSSQSGLPAGAIKEEFFLAVSGPCDRGEDGDLRQARRVGNNGASNFCTGGYANPEYRATGYTYGVSVPTGYSGGPITIEVFDAPFCRSGTHDFPMYSPGSNASHFTTTYSLWNPGRDPSSPGGPDQTRVMNSSHCGSGSGSYQGRWREFFTVTPAPGQTYTVQVRSSNHETNSRMAGANIFALRARVGSNFRACSSDEYEVDPALRSAATGISVNNCPNVFALQDLSVFAGSDANTAEFFLASIGPEHSGRTLVIELFDPGEGGDTLQVTDPRGNVIGPGNQIGDGFGSLVPGVTSFEYSVRQRLLGEAGTGPAEVAPGGFDGGWGPRTGHTIDIKPAGPAPGPGRAQDSGRCEGYHSSARPACRYNERALRIEIQLPDNIHAAYGGRTWWRIKYNFDQTKNVTDRTTWSVSVEGGPVRLIE